MAHPQLSKALCREALLWRQLDHPSILPFLGIAKIEYPRAAVCMISPWMKGNLAMRIQDQQIHSDSKHTWVGEQFYFKPA